MAVSDTANVPELSRVALGAVKVVLPMMLPSVFLSFYIRVVVSIARQVR
jgi:hypothetical protein